MASAFTTSAAKYPNYARWSFAVIRELRKTLFLLSALRMARHSFVQIHVVHKERCLLLGCVPMKRLRLAGGKVSAIIVVIITTADKLTNNNFVVCKNIHAAAVGRPRHGLVYAEMLPKCWRFGG